MREQLLFAKLGGMDACDKASSMLKCGMDNAPDAVAQIINNLESTLTV